MGFTALIPLIGGIIDKLFPDPAQADAAKLALMKMQLEDKQFGQTLDAKAASDQVDLVKGQLDINKAEASNDNVFVSGWRPAIGWVCAAAFAYQFFLGPVGIFIMGCFNVTAPALPSLDTADLMTILGGLLGLGSLRTFEKIKGVHKK
jgi:hypothetical protein